MKKETPMKRITEITIVVAVLFGAMLNASAQRFSIGTNGIDWLTLGTVNAEASVATSQHFSLHAGAELNPWTYAKGDKEKQFEVRQFSCWGGFRWWPWHVYSGWWAGVDGRYSMYNIGGIVKRTTEEGEAYGGGLYGGYSIMLSDLWNLDLGLGVWGGWKKYTTYACPVCGVITGQGEKAFFMPDARVAIQLIF